MALLGAVSISFSAIFFRLSEVSPSTAAFFRLAYSIPLLIVVAVLVRDGIHRWPRERLIAGAAGVLLGLDLVTWNHSIEIIGAGLGTLITNTQVVIVPLATWAIFRERPSSRALWSMPVVLVGLFFVTGLGRVPGSSDLVFGVSLGVLAALFYAGFLILIRRSNRRLGAPTGPLIDASIGGCLAVGIHGLIAGGLDFSFQWPAHGWLIAMALVSQVIGWFAITYALPRLPASHTSFAILLQPTLTLIWGRLIFGESVAPIQLVGVALILTGIAVATMSRGLAVTPPASIEP